MTPAGARFAGAIHNDHGDGPRTDGAPSRLQRNARGSCRQAVGR